MQPASRSPRNSADSRAGLIKDNPMSSSDKVVWSEGMFLQQQHFQQQERYVERILDARARALAACGWGFVQLTLGVVRVVERRADNQLVLDKAYIPPTLGANENSLLASHVREIHGLLHQRGEALAARLSQPGRGGVAEIADFLFLQTVNRHEPL